MPPPEVHCREGWWYRSANIPASTLLPGRSTGSTVAVESSPTAMMPVAGFQPKLGMPGMQSQGAGEMQDENGRVCQILSSGIRKERVQISRAVFIPVLPKLLSDMH